MQESTENQSGNTTEVKVWDPLVRLFHWGLVLAFTVAYLSGDEESDVHIYAGYVVAGLIIFRLIWGLIGPKHARFSDFVRSPGSVINYMKNMASGRARRYLGHSPAGGAMIVALLLGLAVVTYSGLEVYAIEEGAGPLAQAPEVTLIKAAHADDEADEDAHAGAKYAEHNIDEDEDEEAFWEEIHEASANFVLLLVFLHVAGVLVSGRMHGENLVKAMITGKKKSV